MWKYAWRETVRHKGRAVGNITGYATAIALMVVLISMLSFTNRAAAEVLTTTGTHFIAFLPQCSSEDCSADLIDPINEGFTANGSPAKLLDIAIINQIKALPTVADAQPALYFQMLDPSTQKIFTIIGLSDLGSVAVSNTACSTKDVVTGRFLLPGDQHLVMLEEAFAYAQIIPAGFPIRIGKETFTVAGIINPGIRPAKADIYMTMDDALKVINSRLKTPIQAKMNIVLVESAGAKIHNQAIADVQKVLGERSLISTYSCSTPAANAMGINDNGLKIIFAIVSFALIAFILKSQYSSVIERRTDIGIMKAIGWSSGRVAAQLLGESMIQGGLGLVVGTILAISVISWVPLGSIIGVEAISGVTISWSALKWGLGLALVVGLVAGIVPGLAAGRLKPADILRRI